MQAGSSNQRRDRWNLVHQLELHIVKCTNVVLITIPFAYCWFHFYSRRLATPYYWKGKYVVTLLFVALYCVLGRTYNAFNISLSSISEEAYSQSLSAFISDCFLYVVIFLLTKKIPPALPMLGVFAVQLFFAIAWSFLATQWYFSRFKPIRSVIIWDTRSGNVMEELIRKKKLNARFDVTGTITSRECLQDIAKTLDGVQAVFLCGVHSHDRNIIMKFCVEKSIRVYLIPRVGDMIMNGAKTIHLLHLPMFLVERYNPMPEYLFAKRLLDIVLSGIALMILSPVMIIVAVIIKATDGGTVFYKQVRLTKNGKTFEVLKFRSMRMDAEKDGVARLSSGENDDRITPVGRVIRACRIDELPQLINILKGEMSIVGPRPERPEIAAQYEKKMPEFALRLQAKAGLTGYAQIYGKYNTTPYDKLLMDLQYIAKPNIVEDLRIMFATVKILFMPESTEGVAAGQTTAMENNYTEKDV